MGSAFNRGPEDPRLYWTDQNTPLLTLGFPSTSGMCRGIALIQDVRSVWPELTSVLASSALTSPFRAGYDGPEMVELTKDEPRFV
jgi:hypothetical protein